MRWQRRHSPPPARSGLTLIECLVVITILSVLMTLVGSILFRVYRHQAVLAVATHQTSTWLRLARTLRSDLHATTQVSASGDDGSQLALVLGSDSVTWAIEGDRVQRTSKTSDEAGEAVGAESFVLPHARLKFDISKIDNRQLVRLTATASKQTDDTQPAAHGTIESAVGLDRRWEGGQP